MSGIMKGIVTLVLLVGISAGLFALGKVKRADDKKPLIHVAEEVALTVDAAKPERSDIIRLVQAPGDVEAVLEVEISSEIVAKIEEMPVEEGDVVKAGDLLCRLDDAPLVAAVESAEARIAQLEAGKVQAEVDLEKALRDCARQQELSERDLTNPLELAEYLTTMKKAQAMVEVRRQELVESHAQMKRLTEDLKRTVIESPIDGVVSKINAKQGEVVVTGTMNNPGTVIMSISDLSRMQVKARVDEVDVPRVRAEQPARVYLQSDSNKAVAAKVVRVATKGTKAVGRDVVTFETLLEVLGNDPSVMPGMSANVEIEVARRDQAITVPVEAVVHRLRKELPEGIVKAYDAKQSEMDVSERARQAQYIKVLYVKKELKAEIRLIEPGIADTRRVEIADGLGMDDVVITGPYRSLDQLKDGRSVQLSDASKKILEPEAGKTGDAANVETKTAEGGKKAGDADPPAADQKVASADGGKP
ncbi:MAG: efflux RND transporter periplasmic adaptor subunit [Phycisphaerales bacterium]|nr:efflux RND transporter periplasmic adaptor subunit [Phycisphaerales bacterium]